MSRLISELIQEGPQYYTHHYMQTMTDEESCENVLEVPPSLKVLAVEHPDATVVVYGDDTLGIEIGGKLWAAEMPDREYRPGKRLGARVWQYCNLALGRNGDTVA